MKLNHDLHLAYCTNIHRGESWGETLAALEKYTLAVRDRVCPGKPYAIGLRLSDVASRELSDSPVLFAFQKWLEKHGCYVFTINGFPYGKFHNQKVKENVYRPDWTSDERVEYTNRLFDLLAELVPTGIEGSVSTVPGSFKEFISSEDQRRKIRDNVFRSVEHIAKTSARSGKKLHLGLEPEPLCLLETTPETIEFFAQIRSEHLRDERLTEFLGVNYDACHLAVEFEDAHESLANLQQAGIKISKLHLSSALKMRSAANSRAALSAFAEDVYLHQVVARDANGKLVRYKDLNLALAERKEAEEEWRVHFHIPLHAPPSNLFDNTSDHLRDVFDVLHQNPRLCSHLEMETYTWDVMPPALKSRDVVDQLTAEYGWCLAQLRARGLSD